MTSSSSVIPTVPSTTNSTTSASRTAASTWRLTLASRSLPPGIQPPVSMMRNGTPSHSASSDLRSRVTPGRSSTMAACSPMMRLNSVDLPTLGRPTTTTGEQGDVAAHDRDLQGAAQGVSVGRHDLDGTGQVVDRAAVEEAAVVGQADVGQQVAVPLRLAGEDAGQVGARHQAGDAGVAAEELVADGDDAHVVAPEAGDERGDDAGAELARQDPDGRRAARPQGDRRRGRRGERSPV